MRILLTIILFPLLFQGCASSTAPAAPASAKAGAAGAAIASRAAVGFVYSGVSRLALPHRLGASAAGNGKTLVRAWEVTCGGAPTGQWKLYDVAKIRDPRPLPGAPFAPALGYTPREPRHPRAHRGGARAAGAVNGNW